MDNKMWCLMLQLSISMWRDSPETTVHIEGSWFEDKLLCDKKTWDEVTEFAVENGFNAVLIDLGNAVRYQSHPEIAIEGAWEPEFLKEELQRLRSMGLTPYPKLNFSATHDAWLGQYSRMVSTDTYYKVCRDLIHEVIDLFDQPEFFHLGMDEESVKVAVSCPDLEYVCVRQLGLIWRDLEFYFNCVREKNVRPWIWSDYYWAHPEKFLQNVGKDVLLTPWDYKAMYPITGWPLPSDERSVTIRNSFKNLADAGYDVVSCGSNYENFWNIDHITKFSMENVTPKRDKGILIAPWKTTIDKYKYIIKDAIWQTKYAKDKYVKSNE